jgi:hypothetical protein
MHLVRAILVAMALLTVAPGMALAEDVDLELVLLADATGSIDDGEIAFQRKGYVEALTSADVLDAIRTGAHQRIAVTYVEWGSFESQHIVVPWMVISDEASAAAFATALLAAPRHASGRNAIGQALIFGKALIEGNSHDGYRRVIDLSADSANSWSGIPLATAREQVVAAGITINGLAILCRFCSGRPVSYDLEKAFEDTIIGGPDAFVVTADDMQQFATAVKRKLVLEIAGLTPARAKAAANPVAAP